MILSKFHFSDDYFHFVTVTKNCNGVKKIVKATKNDCYFNRYGCSLQRNKARSSLSQIFVTMTKSFLA